MTLSSSSSVTIRFRRLILSTIFLLFVFSVSLLPSVAMTSTGSHIHRRLPLQIKKLSDKATIPKPGSELSAGIDLSSAVDMVIPPKERALVATDLSIACPPGTYGRVAPRSGLALKKGIDTGAGVIDADYRGPVGVILFNWGNEPFVIKQGDRVAQLILEQIIHPDIEVVDELDETMRGAGGFGSTGGVTSLMSKRPRDNDEEEENVGEEKKEE